MGRASCVCGCSPRVRAANCSSAPKVRTPHALSLRLNPCFGANSTRIEQHWSVAKRRLGCEAACDFAVERNARCRSEWRRLNLKTTQAIFSFVVRLFNGPPNGEGLL